VQTQGSDWDGNPAYVFGTMSRATVCTQFDWVWLSFPVALLVLTTLMLLHRGCARRDVTSKFRSGKRRRCPCCSLGMASGTIGAAKDIRGTEQETQKDYCEIGDSWWELGVF
jgi:hypothetical protein